MQLHFTCIGYLLLLPKSNFHGRPKKERVSELADINEKKEELSEHLSGRVSDNTLAYSA